MNPAVVRIRMLTLALGALMLGVNISLFCFVQYNILKLHMYKAEPAVRSAHYAAEVTTILNCLMCFADCYVICSERAHSKRHVKAMVYAMLSVCIFMSNSGSYYYITNGQYQYTIPTRKITAFYPPNVQDVWYGEIHDYLQEYEDSRNATETRMNAAKLLKTLNHFQKLSHCCGVISYADYTTLGVPIPPTCECESKGLLLRSVRCTRGQKTSFASARAFVGGGIDMTVGQKQMEGGASQNLNGSTARAAANDYELKKYVFKSGCEEDRARCVYVLTGTLRLLVSSVTLQFLSIVMIPIPWLYEK